MTTDNTASTASVWDFARLLFDDTDGVVELRAISSTDEEVTDTMFLQQGDQRRLIRFMWRHAHENQYVGVASRRDASSGKLENCRQLAVLFVDLDFKSVPEPQVRHALAECPFAASLVVASGGGLHVYWRLRDPLDLQNEEERMQARSL